MKRRIVNGSKSVIRGVTQCALRLLVRVSVLQGSKQPELMHPKRILLLDGAHIGDAIIATSLVAVLQNAYPKSEIGCVAGSWSAEVFRNHPGIAAVHIVDHWRLNRTRIPLAAKVKRFVQTRCMALAEIREQRYAMAFALRPWHPDFLDLAWQAGIPVRVGFRSSLLSPLATVLAEYPEDEARPFQSHGECQAELLRACGIGEANLALRQSNLGTGTKSAAEEMRRVLREAGAETKHYSVIHIGSGAAAKEMPNEFWSRLADALTTQETVVFTGYGAREAANVKSILRQVADSDRCVDVCGKLTWPGFVEVLREARSVYGIDSAAVHAAAAVGTPVVAVYSGIGGVGRWRPEGNEVTVWSNPVPCSPCHLKNGCAEMRCMSGMEPSTLLKWE